MSPEEQWGFCRKLHPSACMCLVGLEITAFWGDSVGGVAYGVPGSFRRENPNIPTPAITECDFSFALICHDEESEE